MAEPKKTAVPKAAEAVPPVAAADAEAAAAKTQ